MTEIIEGTWVQVQAALLKRAAENRLGNARVRIIVEDLPDVKEQPSASDPDVQADEWIRNLKAWAESHPKLDYEVDDSRDSIYNEVVRDPR